MLCTSYDGPYNVKNMKKTYNQIDEATSYTTVTIFAEEPEGFNAKIPGHVIATPGIIDQYNFLSEIEWPQYTARLVADNKEEW